MLKKIRKTSFFRKFFFFLVNCWEKVFSLFFQNFIKNHQKFNEIQQKIFFLAIKRKKDITNLFRDQTTGH